eukprot:TRINITY_DN31702_c0_g1_i1.p1 TRINITY_DN31702_c0_g1~~TRINITY_DN31702_c0_g1_i1.p1  ORF type:complete len:126 (+),score=11.90 TRINITY_DN31702_c0_g1_i1:184-561(+)
MVFVILMLKPLKNAALAEDLMVPAINVKLDSTLSMENAKNQTLLDVLRKIMLVFASTALQVFILELVHVLRLSKIVLNSLTMIEKSALIAQEDSVFTIISVSKTLSWVARMKSIMSVKNATNLSS